MSPLKVKICILVGLKSHVIGLQSPFPYRRCKSLIISDLIYFPCDIRLFRPDAVAFKQLDNVRYRCGVNESRISVTLYVAWKTALYKIFKLNNDVNLLYTQYCFGVCL